MQQIHRKILKQYEQVRRHLARFPLASVNLRFNYSTIIETAMSTVKFSKFDILKSPFQ